MTISDLQADARGRVAATPQSRPWHNTTATADYRVESLLEQMTVEEKLAQLGSKWLGFGAENTENVGPMQDAFSSIDVTFEQASEHGLGHITRVFGTAPISAREGIARLVALQNQVVDDTRLGVPAIVHEECLTGFTTLGATVYPTAIAWAATFDPDLVERMASAIGADLRAVGAHQGLSPVLDVVRDYRWGCVEETLGEDPYLVSILGTA
jgi:beta-glucosidase-like glycosyl hydrolase